MRNNLQVGQSSLEIHNQWGEPDIRTDLGDRTQLWSYAERPNSNDLTAALLYTAPKPGDKGKFLDLEIVDGKLVSWSEAEHTMPPKQGSAFSYGLTGIPPAGSPTMHY